MKKIFLTLIITVLLFGGMLFLSPQTAEARSYRYGGTLRYQRGYTRSNGTYVQPHFKTNPDNYTWNNRKSLYGW